MIDALLTLGAGVLSVTMLNLFMWDSRRKFPNEDLMQENTEATDNFPFPVPQSVFNKTNKYAMANGLQEIDNDFKKENPVKGLLVAPNIPYPFNYEYPLFTTITTTDEDSNSVGKSSENHVDGPVQDWSYEKGLEKKVEHKEHFENSQQFVISTLESWPETSKTGFNSDISGISGNSSGDTSQGLDLRSPTNTSTSSLLTNLSKLSDFVDQPYSVAQPSSNVRSNHGRLDPKTSKFSSNSKLVSWEEASIERERFIADYEEEQPKSTLFTGNDRTPYY